MKIHLKKPLTVLSGFDGTLKLEPGTGVEYHRSYRSQVIRHHITYTDPATGVTYMSAIKEQHPCQQFTRGSRICVPGRQVQEAVVVTVYDEESAKAKVLRTTNPEVGKFITVKLSGRFPAFDCQFNGE